MLKVICWGSRGSIPVNGPQFARHGGSTTCLELRPQRSGDDTPPRIIIDCGTGLASLGHQGEAPCREALVLQTHVHWDHIQGFPFFGPLFDGGARFELWSVDREHRSLQDVLGDQMKGPCFPVRLADLPADLSFGRLSPAGRREVGEVQIRWAEMCHPSGSTAFRVDYRSVSAVFSGDVEVRMGGRDELIELSDGADLLIMDAQYFDEEYDQRRGFGHSTPEDAVEVALEAGVKRLWLTHHDPTHGDRRLDEKLAIARGHARQLGASELRIENARDGLEIGLEPMPSRPSTGLTSDTSLPAGP